MTQRDAKGRFVSSKASADVPKAEQMRVYGKTKAKPPKTPEPPEPPKFPLKDLPEELRAKILKSVYKLRTNEREAMVKQYHEWAKNNNPSTQGRVLSLNQAKMIVDALIQKHVDMKATQRDVENRTFNDLNPENNFKGRHNPDWQWEHASRRESAGIEKFAYAEDPDLLSTGGFVRYSAPKQERHDSGLDEF